MDIVADYAGELLANLFEYSEAAIAMVDQQYRLLVANEKFQKVIGWQQGGAVGQAVTPYPGQQPYWQQALAGTACTYQEGGYRFQFRPLGGQSQQELVAVAIATQVSEPELTEKRWQLAVKLSKNGVWDADLRAQVYYFSDACLAILGHTRNQFSARAWVELIHPADREQRQEALEATSRGKHPTIEPSTGFVVLMAAITG